MILSSKDEGNEKLERRITRISRVQAAGGWRATIEFFLNFVNDDTRDDWRTNLHEYRFYDRRVDDCVGEPPFILCLSLSVISNSACLNIV